MKEKKEFLAFEFKVDDADESGDIGMIEGYASTFGNVDLGLDIVEKGAFRKTIKEKKGVFPILLDHNPTKHAGWNIEASEDDKGLKVKGELDLTMPEVRSRWKLAKRARELGAKMGLSIGYRTIKEEIIKDSDPTKPWIRKLKEIKLFEYSLVTFPMNEQASVTAAKAEQDQLKGALFEALQTRGYDQKYIEMALAIAFPETGAKSEAAEKETDPKLLQSVDRLIQQLRT